MTDSYQKKKKKSKKNLRKRSWWNLSNEVWNNGLSCNFSRWRLLWEEKQGSQVNRKGVPTVVLLCKRYTEVRVYRYISIQTGISGSLKFLHWHIGNRPNLCSYSESNLQRTGKNTSSVRNYRTVGLQPSSCWILLFKLWGMYFSPNDVIWSTYWRHVLIIYGLKSGLDDAWSVLKVSSWLVQIRPKWFRKRECFRKRGKLQN